MQELCENCDYEIFGKNLMKILYVNESNLVKLRQEEDKTAKEFFQYIKVNFKKSYLSDVFIYNKEKTGSFK